MPQNKLEELKIIDSRSANLKKFAWKISPNKFLERFFHEVFFF